MIDSKRRMIGYAIEAVGKHGSVVLHVPGRDKGWSVHQAKLIFNEGDEGFVEGRTVYDDIIRIAVADIVAVIEGQADDDD